MENKIKIIKEDIQKKKRHTNFIVTEHTGKIKLSELIGNLVVSEVNKTEKTQ